MSTLRAVSGAGHALVDPTSRLVGTGTRVFALAFCLGLLLSSARPASLALPFALLCLLAAAVSFSARFSPIRAAGPVVEATLVGLLLAVLGQEGSPLLGYLLVPPLLAGVQAGARVAPAATLTEVASGLPVVLLTDHGGDVTALLERTGPWAAVGLVLGLLGTWVRLSSRSAHSEQGRYESAHRLLARLQTVAKDLPQGLDAPSLAQRTVSHALASLDVARALLLLRDKGEGLFELASQGPRPFPESPVGDPLVAACCERREPQQGRLEATPDGASCRTVLPLRVEGRIVGVLVVDTEAPLSRRDLRSLQAHLDEQSLRLESAMLFEQVRSTATVEERHRLAREIHDGIAQEIASLGYLVDELAATTDDPDGKQVARQLRGELTRIVSELRFSIFDLRMEVTQHGGLAQALSDYSRDVAGRSGVTVHMALAESGPRLRVDVETELLRIAQEAITNVRKHACADNLWVTLNASGGVVLLRVEDDGVGSARPKEGHYGLQMMRERADRIGAEIAIAPRPRGGTSVVVAYQPSSLAESGAHRDDLSPAR